MLRAPAGNKHNFRIQFPLDCSNLAQRSQLLNQLSIGFEKQKTLNLILKQLIFIVAMFNLGMTNIETKFTALTQLKSQEKRKLLKLAVTLTLRSGRCSQIYCKKTVFRCMLAYTLDIRPSSKYQSNFWVKLAGLTI